MTAFIPSFRLNLGCAIQPGLATLGRFDGAHPSLAFATSADTILIHSPHDPSSSSDSSQLRTLAINRRISALTSGSLSSPLGGQSDQLMVGSDTSLLCYDVENNKDIFFQDVKDGVHALTVGRLSSSALSPSLVLVGGNSAVTGLDMLGVESYWTAMSDSVGALCTRPSGKDSHELIVGTADRSLRVLSGSTVVAEMTEAAAVASLTPIQQSLFAFALTNGTVGVYNNHTRVWMAKSKHSAHSLAAFDLDGDGVNEVVSGWSHGRLEVRHQDSGELVYKDKFASAVAAVIVGDLRGEGKDAIIACSTAGEVRGYQPLSSSPPHGSPSVLPVGSEVAGLRVGLADDEMLDGKRKDLYDRKNELLDELRLYETALKTAKTSKPGGANGGAAAPASVSSPTSTQLTVSLKPNKSTQSQLLTVSTNNDTVIKLLMVTADGLFGANESRTVIPSKEKLSGSLSMTMRSERNVAVEVKVRVVVGHRGAASDVVFEFVEQLPRFSNFLYCKPRDMNLQPPKGSVTFHTTERVNRLVLWLNAAFHLDTNPTMSGVGGAGGGATSPLTLSVTSDSLLVSFLHLLTMTPLIVKMTPEHGGTVVVKTDSFELAGDLIQDFCLYCKVDEVESVADFQNDWQRLSDLMASIDGYNDARVRMSGDMAERTQVLKMGVVKAEDARMQKEVGRVRKGYQAVYEGNGDMLAEYVKREANQQQLLRDLKELNTMIQRAARCRMGDAKTRLIAACRQAVKTNNAKALLKIMKVGKEKE